MYGVPDSVLLQTAREHCGLQALGHEDRDDRRFHCRVEDNRLVDG